MMDDDAKFVSVDKLPDEPLKMPPPYWRTGGACFQVEEAEDSYADLQVGKDGLHWSKVRKTIEESYNEGCG